MRNKLSLIVVSLMMAVTLIGTVFAQRVPQGHLPVKRTSSYSLWNIDNVKFSPDGKVVATTKAFGDVMLINAKTGDMLENFANPKWVHSFAFSPDGRTLVTGSYLGKLRLWDTGDVDVDIGLRDRLGEAGVLMGHKARIFGIAYSPDGTRIASGSQDKTIRIWNAETREHLRTIKGCPGPVYSVLFSPDGAMVAAGSLGSAYLWDADTGRRIHSFDQRGVAKHQVPAVTSVIFSQDGRKLITGNSGGDVHVWQVDTGKHIHRVIRAKETYRNMGPVYSLALSPDGKTVAISSAYGGIHLWDGNATSPPKRLMRKIVANTGAKGVAFSADGARIAVVNSSQIYLWDANTGADLWSLPIRRF